jgi:hypothetical protein
MAFVRRGLQDLIAKGVATIPMPVPGQLSLMATPPKLQNEKLRYALVDSVKHADRLPHPAPAAPSSSPPPVLEMDAAVYNFETAPKAPRHTQKKYLKSGGIVPLGVYLGVLL